MPIAFPERPNDPQTRAAEANRRGVALRAQGRLDEAIAAFREAAGAQPHSAVLHVNLATALAEASDLAGALNEYERAVAIQPDFAAALNGLASLHVRAGRFGDARSCYERALALDDADTAAHQGMYELEQIDGNPEKARYHQGRVLERKTLFTHLAPQEQRRVLALMAPGDWQANVPVDYLIDPATTTLHKLYVLSADQIARAALPRVDVIFVAIGESEESSQALALCEQIVQRAGVPYINKPRKIAATNRVTVSQALSGIANVSAPQVERVSRDALARQTFKAGFPLVVRPAGSQAGRDLARVDDGGELQSYLAGVDAEIFYAMPFADFRAADGYYRKYRVIVVDGVAYPYHLAISPNWMIHYYNTPMRESAWMRDEEAAFLENFESVFGPPLQRALRDVAQAIGLEYFGIDCSIDRDGRLLIFEADPAMLVHAADDPELFGYKHPYAHRIFRAFGELIDRARSA